MTTTIRRRFLLILVVLAPVAAAFTALGGSALAHAKEPPKFYLVGVGPGDPDLMTLRAVKVIDKADLIFCSERWAEKLASHLEGKEVVHGYWRLFPYYGRDPSEFEGEQRRRCEQITRRRNEFIAQVRGALKDGRTVAVLDSGDPLIYGPSAWCLEEFEDLDPVVVPGLSCFNAANAALRRGITTSENTKSVILTASDWPGKTDTIERLSVHRTTMVVFTMRTEFAEFIEKLSVNYPPQTPVAIVKHAGYVDKQEVIQGTLRTIPDQIDQEKLPFEYLIYVGDFLTHRSKNPEPPKHRPVEGPMCSLPKLHYHREASDPEWLAYATQFHGHLGPWATAGLRAGMCGRRAVEAEGYFDLEVTAEGPLVKPPQSCFLDGLQVSTGATWGKRNLKWIKAEKICVRVKNTRTGKVAEVRPTPKLMQLVTSFKPRPKAAGAATQPDEDDHERADRELEAIARRIAWLPEREIFEVALVQQ